MRTHIILKRLIPDKYLIWCSRMIPVFFLACASQLLVLFYGWKSFKAIKSVGSDDDTQWLTFWFIYSLFCFAEIFVDVILGWLPLYYEIRFAFLCYLGLFRGARQCFKC